MLFLEREKLATLSGRDVGWVALGLSLGWTVRELGLLADCSPIVVRRFIEKHGIGTASEPMAWPTDGVEFLDDVST